MTIADAARNIRHVFLHDMLLDLRIGVYADEYGRGQRVRISVDLGVEEQPGVMVERLEQVVDYAEIADRVRSIATAGHVILVESLAERIAADCLADVRIVSARVRVEKLDAFDDIGSAGVEVERLRAVEVERRRAG